MGHIQRNIILGLFVLLPIWLTLYFAYIIFILLAKFTYPLLSGLAIYDNKFVMYPICFILSLIIMYGIGLLTKVWLGEKLLSFIDESIKNVPIIGSFYKSLKQLADTFNSKEKGEQKVVLINFPSEEMKTIGFIIKTMRDSKTNQVLASVFVPTTPNPTSGYLEIVPIEKTTPLDWTFEEAMSFIISGGSSMPNKSLSLS
ncbi:MAG TPA: DUF502 domain-containing protein [Gammaproteobacteria bacterium]|nr:DUF502 domain-containing protein [Gammaproteobacteria bacterium]